MSVRGGEMLFYLSEEMKKQYSWTHKVHCESRHCVLNPFPDCTKRFRKRRRRFFNALSLVSRVSSSVFFDLILFTRNTHSFPSNTGRGFRTECLLFVFPGEKRVHQLELFLHFLWLKEKHLFLSDRETQITGLIDDSRKVKWPCSLFTTWLTSREKNKWLNWLCPNFTLKIYGYFMQISGDNSLLYYQWVTLSWLETWLW